MVQISKLCCRDVAYLNRKSFCVVIVSCWNVLLLWTAISSRCLSWHNQNVYHKTEWSLASSSRTECERWFWNKLISRRSTRCGPVTHSAVSMATLHCKASHFCSRGHFPLSFGFHQCFHHSHNCNFHTLIVPNSYNITSGTLQLEALSSAAEPFMNMSGMSCGCIALKCLCSLG